MLTAFATALTICTVTSTAPSAQTWDYGETAWTWEDIGSTGIRQELVAQEATTVSLPFVFPWFGQPVTELGLSGNGYVVVGGGPTSLVVAGSLGDPAEPNDVLAPLWADLDADAPGASVTTATLGYSPWRQFVIQWDEVPYQGTALTNTFQVVFHEVSGDVEIKLADVAPGYMHTIGLEDHDGTEALLIDHSANGYVERAWLLRGSTTLGDACPLDEVHTFWFDSDGDGYGGDLVSVEACEPPAGFVANRTDCDDASAAVHPGAAEVCNGVDDDCDALLDENGAGVALGLRVWRFRDLDGDAFGAGAPALLCPTEGSNNSLDCNDANAAIYPGAPELCDGADNDCDGRIDVGLIDVGVACIDPARSGRCASGTTRCVEGHLLCQSVGPLPETCDGDDNDCDGVTDEVDDAPASHQHAEIGLYLTFDQRTDATVIDLAGEPDNGTLMGATRLPNGGRYQSGVHVSPQEYILFQDGPKHETDLSNYEAFTLSVWVKVYGNPTGNYVVMEREHQFRIRMVGGEPYFHAIGVSPPREYRAYSTIVPNVWNHLVFVYDGARVRWYINGVNVMSWPDVLDPFTPADSLLTIGSTAADGMDADVDEFILWRHPLSPEGVAAIYVPPGQFEPYAPGGNVRCDTGLLGICGTGYTHCSAAAGYVMVCEPTPPLAQEVCNGLDDDCDGETDEPNTAAEVGYGAQGGGTCDTGQPGPCRPGHLYCLEGELQCVRNVEPATDLCDGIDNDCDGPKDEDDPNVGKPCHTGNLGVCGPGALACVATGPNTAERRCVGIEPGSQEEVCNGLDDDCDGLTDNSGDGPLTRVCGCFEAGTQRCIDGAWDRCTARYPTPELCNGIDDDCDGDTDEGLLQHCSTACGDGVQACLVGTWAACSAREPRMELCNGLDDDCNGLIDEDLYCGCKVYPTGGDPTPEEVWSWSPSATIGEPMFRRMVGTPLVAPLYDTNYDGVIDTDDRPMVVVMTAHEGDPTRGALRVIDGRNGTLRATLAATQLDALTTPAIAELTGGVRPDIVAYVHPDQGGGVALLESTGELRWHNTEIAKGSTSLRGALAIAEIDHDTVLPEVVGCGFVLLADGTTFWVDHDHTTSPWCSPTLVDLDDDMALEVVIGGMAWRGTGDLMWHNPAFIASNGGAVDAPVSVADLDHDGAPDLVLVSGDVWVLEARTGAMKARLALPGGGRGGQAHLADVNGDGRVEIIVAGASQLTAMQYLDTGVTRSLQSLWTVAIADSSGVATATSMDLTNDGVAEVVFADNQWLSVLDGLTGDSLHTLPNWAARHTSMPVFADVTEDGEANLVVVSSSLDGHQSGYDDPPSAPYDRLTVYGGALSPWPQTREVFNARSYHVTNVQDDMRVPRYEAPHWKEAATNVFGANIVTNAAQFDAPDLTMSILEFAQGEEVDACPAWNALTVEVCNVGDVDVPAGLELLLTADPAPIPGWTQTLTLSEALSHDAPNNCEALVFGFVGPADGLFSLTVTVDPGDTFAECREGNNTANRPFAWLQAPTAEVCDGIDNDCDGGVDTDARGRRLRRACYSACGNGFQNCIDGAWSACSSPRPAPEVCDGIDNDCDGFVDEEAEACMRGQTCICTVVDDHLDCACVDTLTVPAPCTLGCPLGTACNGESCVPWCEADHGCPDGQRCADHRCVEGVSAPAEELTPVASEPLSTACAATPSGRTVSGALVAVAILLGVWMMARRR